MRNKRIALHTTKSFEAYCGIFSIFLSGNVWVPLNPTQPANRLKDMIKVAEPQMILTDCKIDEEILEHAAKEKIKVLNLQEIIGKNDHKEFELCDFNYDDIAYIMFTSGSTGVPKGVPVSHENYINFIKNAIEILPLGKYEVFFDYHDFAFDISVFYLFCVVLTESAFAPAISAQDKIWPIENIVKNKVSVWATVPSSISQIQSLSEKEKIETHIKLMFLCGEPLRLETLKYCYENLGIKHVFNFYGLTETGVENFYHECQQDDIKKYSNQGYVPIGKPLKGNSILVTKDKELLLSGCQITPGYLGGNGHEKFELIDGVRFFHTGDIVETYKDVVFCKGRMDSQVKIGGYRVELMDIEVNVRKFVGIRETVCFVDNSNSRTRIIAVLESKNIDKKALKLFLVKLLPHYMIPKIFYEFEILPRNNSGKLDRANIIKLCRQKIDSEN